MGTKIKCFWIEPTDQVMRSLRRFTYTEKRVCPAGGNHEASQEIGQCGASECPKLYEGNPVHGDLWPHDDPMWPKNCRKCGEAFQEDDEWQFRPDTLYRRTDTGEVFTAHNAPPGAMRHAEWMSHFDHYNLDDIILECKLPGGTWWCVDGRANNGTPGSPGWTRTGVVPEITARPSIAAPNYHGFLTDGYLDEC